MPWTTSQQYPISVFLPTRRHLLVVTAFTLLLSVLLQRISGSPYLEVFGRVGFIGAALLVVYSAAGQLRPRWMGPRLVRLAAVVLAAPLAAFATILVAERGNVLDHLQQPQAQVAYIAMVVMAVFFGVPFSLVAMRGERRQRERADRLQVELEKNRLERELLDMRLRVLHAQIEPHFLFNTLGAVQQLAADGAPRAAALTADLIAFLRASFSDMRCEQVALATEFATIASYLRVMQARMGARLRFELALPEALARIEVPSMIVLTLVENAIKHGIEPSLRGGEIHVTAEADPDQVRIRVRDSGVGMSATPGDGAGLDNVRRRLELAYGPCGALALRDAEPGLIAELSIPASARKTA